MANIVLFQQKEKRVYDLSQIYNPEIDGVDIAASGKIVPALRSLVFDDTNGLRNTAYTVWYVDPVTLKTTLKPIRVLATEDGEPDRILSYGNDIYMLYFATVTTQDAHGNNVTNTKLFVDSKLALFGNNTVEYELVRTNIDGTKTKISINRNTSNVDTGTLVPLVDTAVPGIRKCGSCYTYSAIAENDIIAMNLYDAASILTGTIQLVAKKALILNDLDDSVNPVTDFILTANQMKNDELILYVNQNVSDLNIYPELIFADETSQVVAVDNMSGFAYGLEDVKTLYPGMQYQITVKYYLSPDITSTIAQGEENRFVAVTKTLRIINHDVFSISKISVVPVWSSANSEWSLLFYGYYQKRDAMNILGTVTLTGTQFSGTTFGSQQVIDIQVAQTMDNGQVTNYTQRFCIEVRDPVSPLPAFLISPTSISPDTEIYGNNNLPHKRSVINYNAGTGKYYVSSSKFLTKAEFLHNFYDIATPPYLTDTETQAPVPTHFTLREAGSGRVLLTSAQSVDNYDSPLTLLTIGATSQFVDSVIVMEFLKYSNGVYQILYGVPVQVKLP